MATASAAASPVMISETSSPPNLEEDPTVQLPLKPQQRHHNDSRMMTMSSKATTTDETASTADDSLSVATSSTHNAHHHYYYHGSSLFVPPVAAVNVDTRGVRQRLRDQEAKINALLHSTTANNNKPTQLPAAASEGILLKLVQTLEEDLKKTEAEKVQLQEDLEELAKQQRQHQQKKDAEADDKEDGSVAVVASVEAPPPPVETATTAAATHERVAQLEAEVRQKTNHISLLHERWETTLRRMVAYQCDVETHDVHYTQYAAQQREAGQDALEELRDLTAKGQPKETRQLGKKAKHMMSMLLNDLEALGERYQEARVSHEQQLAHLRHTQGQWQRRAEFLQAKLSHEGIIMEEDDDMLTLTTEASTLSGPLMTFRDKLRLQETAARAVQDELGAKLQAAQWEAHQSQVEQEVLRKEVERLRQTVSQLQDVTQQQHDALQTVSTAAAAPPTTAPKKKKLFAFRKKSKTPPATATVVPPSQPPHVVVDVMAALAPMQQESRRFDVLHERMQSQRHALLRMQTDLHQEMRQNAQLVQTVADLRVEQEQTAATKERAAVLDLQDQLHDLEVQREKDQQNALATIQALQARLKALESTK